MAQDLRDTYCRRHGKLKKCPWREKEPKYFDMENIFTSLLIHVKVPEYGQPLKYHLDSYEEMLSRTSRTGQPITRILVQGEPGCGKTTLMDKIAYDWATKGNFDSTIGKIDLLFYVKMRWIDKGANIEHAIVKQLLAEDVDVSPEELLKIIRDTSLSAKICIILDGYDECDHLKLTNAQSQSNISKILRNTFLKHCIVVVTTRPADVINLGELREYEVFEVAGFTKENVETFVRKFMDDNSESSKFLRFLENTGVKQELASMPIVTHLLCLYWESRKVQTECLPTTLSELYTEIHLFINEHYLNKLDLQGTELKKKENELEHMGIKLREISFKGLWFSQQKLSWTREELDNLDNYQVEEACKIGVLSQEEMSGTISGSKVRSRLRKVTCFEFFHSTSQEMFAGEHLGNLTVEKATSYMNCIKTIYDALALQMVLLFACGASVAGGTSVAEVIIMYLIELFASDLLPKIAQYYNGELDFEDTKAFQMYYDLCLRCNFESQMGNKFVQGLLTLFPERTIVFYGMPCQTAEALRYLLCNTPDPKCISTLKIVGVPRPGKVISITESTNTLVDKEYKGLRDVIGRKPCSEFQTLLQSYAKTAPIITKIAEEGGETKAVVNGHLWQKFKEWQGGSTFLEPLVDGAAQVELTELNLRGVALGSHSAKLFQKMKEGYFTSLSVLNLRDTELQEEDVKSFIDTIDQLNKLSILDISYNKIQRALPHLTDQLTQHPEHGVLLRKLDVRDSQIASESSTHFWRYFPNFCKHLEEVYTHGSSNHTNDEGITLLIENIPKCRNLTAVTLSVGDITNSKHISKFLAVISDTLVWNIAIYEVPLEPDEFIHVLMKGLAICNQLRWIMLGCSDPSTRSVLRKPVQKEAFQGLIGVLRGMRLVKRFGLKDIPLDLQCLDTMLDLARVNGFEELM